MSCFVGVKCTTLNLYINRRAFNASIKARCHNLDQVKKHICHLYIIDFSEVSIKLCRHIIDVPVP